MCRLGLHIISIFFLILFSHQAFAQSTETFHGTVSGITMNGKHYSDIHNQTFTLTKKSSSSAEITGTIEKIGKMPGVLHFKIPVAVSTDGTLSCKQEAEVGEIKMKVGISKSMKSKSFKGKYANRKLSFSLRVISKMLGIKVADASFQFDTE